MPEIGVPGPIVWLEWPRENAGVITDFYADQDIADDPAYYGGFKEARVLAFGSGTRLLSDQVNGNPRSATFNLTISDYDYRFRRQLASVADRYWIYPLIVRMTSLANRAALGLPYVAFTGPIADAQPVRPLGWEITLTDIITFGMLGDDHQIPWRMVRDSFLSQMTMVSKDLDPMLPEPIIYGRHLRDPLSDPASPQGFRRVPTYMGTMEFSAVPYHVWLVAGHACADILDVYVDYGTAEVGINSVLPAEGFDWLIPHYAGWNAEFGAPYVDLMSDTFGVNRRYTLILGKVGSADPEACAGGQATLTCDVEGVEANGDGSGTVEQDRFQQYKHFLINYVANVGPASYQSGAYLTNPEWQVSDAPVPIVNEASFDAASAVGVFRLPDAGPDYPAGYVGAAIIGATQGDRGTVKSWIAAWNRSCGCRSSSTHFGQYGIWMLSPTDAIKAAAPLFSDAYEMLQGSFSTHVGWRGEHANNIPWVADFSHEIGKWMTTGTAVWASSVAAYVRDIVGEQREYPFAPGVTMANHLAFIEVVRVQHPPRTIQFRSPISLDSYGQSLALLDVGDYIRYQHYAAVGAQAEIRLAQIVAHQVLAGERAVLVEAEDCEDLIDFDAPVAS